MWDTLIRDLRQAAGGLRAARCWHSVLVPRTSAA